MTSLNVNQLNVTTITPECNFTSMTVPTLGRFLSSTMASNTDYVNNCITGNIVPIYKAFTANTITSTVTPNISGINPYYGALSICPTAGSTLTINPAMTTLSLKGTPQSFSSLWNFILTSPITSTKMLSGSGTFSNGQAGISFTPNFTTIPTVILTVTVGTTAGVFYYVTNITTAGAVARCSQFIYTFNWVAIGT